MRQYSQPFNTLAARKVTQESEAVTPYSNKDISKALLHDVVSAIQSIDAYGSVEIYVQDSTVTQITVRNIKKTNHVNGNGHRKK